MKALIVEDEVMAADRLAKMVRETEPDIDITAILESVEDTVAYLSKHDSPDFILMDIQLSDGISFEIFDLVNITCPVIFTTAYDEYALDAFRIHAMDYLLKPIKSGELAGVLGRLHDMRNRPNDLVKQLDYPGQTKKVLVKLGQNLKVLALNEAAFYYSENKITFYMDVGGKRYPVDFSLDKLESMLNANQFFRVNRQYIVNEKSITNMVTYSINRIKLHLQPSPPDDVIVSKDKASRFRKWLVN